MVYSVKRNLPLWQFAGFGFTTLMGTLLHFLYDWTNGSLWVAPFSGVNESTWEHIKLLFFPLWIFALVQSGYFQGNRNFWCIKLRGILTGVLLIPVLFYTYNGVIGKSPDWVNIAIFYVTAAIVYFVEWRLFKKINLQCKRPWIPFSLILLLGILFVVFTFRTPRIGIFEDPLTGAYGLWG